MNIIFGKLYKIYRYFKKYRGETTKSFDRRKREGFFEVIPYLDARNQSELNLQRARRKGSEDLPKWEKVKGAKAIQRISKHTGKPYIYREGKVAFPDALDKPSRTLLTREGGSYICREKHVIYQNGRYRRLHPIELERLNGFPDDFTNCSGITDIQRAFFMGNALVVGVIKRLGKELVKAISKN